MITPSNYYQQIKNYTIPKTQKSLINGMQFIDKITQNGKNWSEYKSTDWIRTLVDSFFRELNQYLDLNPKARKSIKSRANGDQLQAKDSIRGDKKTKANATSIETMIRRAEKRGKRVPNLSEEIKIIRQFVYLHNKEKTMDEIRYFINLIQRAIAQEKIRATSTYGKEIMEIQISLIRVFESKFSEGKVTLQISEAKRQHYLEIISKQQENPSVRIIKSFIELQARPIGYNSAKTLYNRIVRGINSSRISLKDKYWKQIEKMMLILKAFLFKNPIGGYLTITKSELNGIKSSNPQLAKPQKKGSKGLSGIAEDTIMNSMDIINLQVDTLGFKGIWKEFIGDPIKGFTAMVFGMPKFGKSTLCLEFAGYLARNHGRVLYVAKEEQIGGTLINKLKETNVAHPNLESVGTIPEDLSAYDFVFLDSVTKLGLTPADLTRLKNEYPGISFIYVFQVTKQGAFRGANGFQHDVDIVIEVPQRGVAIQYGRFNQGGEINIFS